jgi:ethanolamine-phosphate cytidylyltransferase
MQSIVKQPEELEFREFGRRKKPNRGFVDGCFDLVHSGHFNAIRQAASLSDTLVVGVNSDSEILKNKGPAILNSVERNAVVKACKWVSECHEDTDYVVTEKLLDDYNCDFYLHGDDPVISLDGTNVCEELNKKGKFRVFKRTTGISTTNITGRLLNLIEEEVEEDGPSLPIVATPKQQFLQTSTRIANFSN